MKKIIYFLLTTIFLSISGNTISYYYNYSNRYYTHYNFNYYYNYYYSPYVSIDHCCIIETIDYKEKLKFIEETIYDKYPDIASKIDSYVCNFRRKLKMKIKNEEKRIKAYKKTAEKIIDYAYNNNIQKGTTTYLILSYFTYRIYDIYTYENNKGKYNIENLIENLDQNHYDY